MAAKLSKPQTTPRVDTNLQEQCTAWRPQAGAQVAWYCCLCCRRASLRAAQQAGAGRAPLSELLPMGEPARRQVSTTQGMPPSDLKSAAGLRPCPRAHRLSGAVAPPRPLPPAPQPPPASSPPQKGATSTGLPADLAFRVHQPPLVIQRLIKLHAPEVRHRLGLEGLREVALRRMGGREGWAGRRVLPPLPSGRTCLPRHPPSNEDSPGSQMRTLPARAQSMQKKAAAPSSLFGTLP